MKYTMLSARQFAKRAAISAGLELSGFFQRSGAWRMAGGRGVIFTLHHVRPAEAKAFSPNAHLEITPDFLNQLLVRLKKDGYRFVDLASISELSRVADEGAPFAAFTLDDGYRNNLVYALPVFQRHQAPFTVFVAKGLVERSHTLWWETLGTLLGNVSSLHFDFGEGEESLRADTLASKHRLFARFAAFIHRHDEATAVAAVDQLASRNGIDARGIVEDLVMDVEELRVISRHPLASLGAHTVSHRALARLPDDAAQQEIASSVDYVGGLTGSRPSTFAFPYGTPEAAGQREAALLRSLGLAIGVTTQPGVIGGDANATYLPRMSINGLFQKSRYVSALASGIPMKLMKR